MCISFFLHASSTAMRSSTGHILRVGQNHIYTVHMQYFGWEITEYTVL